MSPSKAQQTIKNWQGTKVNLSPMIKLVNKIMTISKLLNVDLWKKKGHSGVSYTMKMTPITWATVRPRRGRPRLCAIIMRQTKNLSKT